MQNFAGVFVALIAVVPLLSACQHPSGRLPASAAGQSENTIRDEARQQEIERELEQEKAARDAQRAQQMVPPMMPHY